MAQKNVRSAVIISPPQHFWPQIQAIRSEHDRAYDRWLPHINLLYPFNPEPECGFTDEAVRVKEAVQKANIKPFKVLFSKESFGYFKQGKRSVVWLKPLFIKDKEVTKVTEKQLMPAVKPKPEPSSELENLSTKLMITEPVIDKPSKMHAHSGANVGLSALKDATWDESKEPSQSQNAASATAGNISPGLDCLRYAVYGSEKEEQIDELANAEAETKKRKYPLKVNDTGVSVHNKDEYYRSKEAGSDEDSNRKTADDESTDLRTVKLKEGYGCFPVNLEKERKVHGEVLKLQNELEKAFPHCNDLGKKGEAGFSPHLTLGQCDKKSVDSFVDKLKKEWKDFYFTVDCVHIISRRDSDPFEVRETVSFI